MVDVIVTSHAILRYLERVDGPHPMCERGRIDIEAVRRIILADGRKAAFAAGAKNVQIGDVVFCSRTDGTARIVTTVIPASLDGGMKSQHPSNMRKPKNGRGNKHKRREEK